MVNIACQIRTSCLIVGGGGSGLRAAVECLKNGLKPLLITKGVIGQSHTLMAEGGINAAIGQRDPSDSWKVHYDDTINAGRFINYKSMVETLCKEAPERIYDLLRYGARIETDKQGKIIQAGRSGGQSKDRTISVGDFIGFVLQRALLSTALQMGLKVLDEIMFLKLIIDNDGEAVGILAFDLRNSQFLVIWSSSIVLACGGGTQIFSQKTSGSETTGEAYVLGLEAGIELRDMEMIQFHPTALCRPSSATGVLVTEAARMLGGRLYNTRGERFMERYDSRMELAPRDIITRAIIEQVKEGGGTLNGAVYLDLTHIKSKVILSKLPNTVNFIKTFQGIDITRQPIEVGPAAHYFMGGLVASNIETMETIPGVFICGEISWGSHGANRIGGNSLAETQVFGARAGRGAVLRYRKIGFKRCNISERKLAEQFGSIDELLTHSRKGTSSSIYQIRNKLGRIMFENVGVIRNRHNLEEAFRKVTLLHRSFKKCRKDLDNYHSFVHIFECNKMLELSKLIIQSALFRTESRGAHFRSDFPKEAVELYNVSISPDSPHNLRRVDVM